MSITFFMGAGPAVKPVRHFLSPNRMAGHQGWPLPGASADAGELGLVPV